MVPNAVVRRHSSSCDLVFFCDGSVGPVPRFGSTIPDRGPEDVNPTCMESFRVSNVALAKTVVPQSISSQPNDGQVLHGSLDSGGRTNGLLEVGIPLLVIEWIRPCHRHCNRVSSRVSNGWLVLDGLRPLKGCQNDVLGGQNV